MVWLKRLSIAFAILAVTVLAARWAVGRYAARRLAAARSDLAELVGPLELERLAPQAVAEEENAARWILRAAAAINAERYESASAVRERLLCCPLGDWTEGDLDAARRLLEEQAESVALLPRIAAAEGSAFGLPYAEGYEALTERMPDWIGALRLARLAALEARLALAAGDPARHLTAVEALVSTAQALCSEPLAITMIVGVAAARIGLWAVADSVAQAAAWPSDALVRLAAVTAAGSCADQPRRGVGGEAVLVANAGDSWRPPAEWTMRTWLAEPGRMLLEAATVEGFGCFLENLDLPYRELVQVMEGNQCRPGSLDVAYLILVPNLLDGAGKAKAVETSRRLAATAVEAARVWSETGELPDTLALEATPYVGEVPVYTRGDDWAEVAAPESEAFFRTRQDALREAARPLFRFRLEVPTPSPAP